MSRKVRLGYGRGVRRLLPNFAICHLGRVMEASRQEHIGRFLYFWKEARVDEALYSILSCRKIKKRQSISRKSKDFLRARLLFDSG